jgi:hypothetical protein
MDVPFRFSSILAGRCAADRWRGHRLNALREFGFETSFLFSWSQH